MSLPKLPELSKICKITSRCVFSFTKNALFTSEHFKPAPCLFLLKLIIRTFTYVQNVLLTAAPAVAALLMFCSRFTEGATIKGFFHNDDFFLHHLKSPFKISIAIPNLEMD